jgi:peptide chain release factor subunit 1
MRCVSHAHVLAPLDPAPQVSRVAKMLCDEFGTASNIKNRVNRQASAFRRRVPYPRRCRAPDTRRRTAPPQSVLGAITSAQQRLKLYNKARRRGSGRASQAPAAPA